MRIFTSLFILFFILTCFSSAIADKVLVIPLAGDTKVYSSINWRGEWTEDNQYEIGDGTQHDGCSYICILKHSSNSSNSPPEVDHWSLLADKGKQGHEGPPGPQISIQMRQSGSYTTLLPGEVAGYFNHCQEGETVIGGGCRQQCGDEHCDSLMLLQSGIGGHDYYGTVWVCRFRNFTDTTVTQYVTMDVTCLSGD